VKRWGEFDAYFTTPALLLVGLALHSLRGDSLDRTLREYAGTNAIDCGRVFGDAGSGEVIWSDRRALDACTITAFRARKPFYARFDQKLYPDFPGVNPGIASHGIAGTHDGKIYFIDKNRYLRDPCPNPIIVRENSEVEIIGCHPNQYGLCK